MTHLAHGPAATERRQVSTERRALGAVGAVALWAVEAVVAVALVLFIAGIVAAPFVAGWLVARDQHDSAAGPVADPRPAAGWASASADGPLLLFPFAGEAVLIGPDGPVGDGCRVTSPVPVTRLTLTARTAYRVGGHPGAVTCRVGEAEAGLLLEFAETPPTGPAPPAGTLTRLGAQAPSARAGSSDRRA